MINIEKVLYLIKQNVCLKIGIALNIYIYKS